MEHAHSHGKKFGATEELRSFTKGLGIDLVGIAELH